MTLTEIYAALAALAKQAQSLPQEQQAIYYRETQRRFKSPDTFTVLACFPLALANLYLGRTVRFTLTWSAVLSAAISLPYGLWLAPLILIADSALCLRGGQAQAERYNLAQARKILGALRQD